MMHIDFIDFARFFFFFHFTVAPRKFTLLHAAGLVHFLGSTVVRVLNGSSDSRGERGLDPLGALALAGPSPPPTQGAEPLPAVEPHLCPRTAKMICRKTM